MVLKMTDIEKIKKSIQNQIDQQERNYYKDLESKTKHADGTEMYKVDNHKIGLAFFFFFGKIDIESQREKRKEGNCLHSGNLCFFYLYKI